MFVLSITFSVSRSIVPEAELEPEPDIVRSKVVPANTGIETKRFKKYYIWKNKMSAIWNIRK